MTILKGIPRIIPPNLLLTLARMGHGDTLVIADANFPAASVAAHTPGGLINCDGNDAATLLKAVMQLLPLDATCAPVQLMQMMPMHKEAGWKTPIW
jgi:L-fucose mutarotase